MQSTYLTHARVVLPDRVLDNSAVLIDDGRIVAIEPDGARADRVVDLQGQTLLPGLIDLHCDAIEKEAEPRSRVLFPLDFAVAQVDRRNAAAGITTPYHALSFANKDLGVRNNQTAAEVVRTLRAFRPHSLVDNRVHCRYEVTDDTSVPVLRALMEEGAVDLLSVMDHSPGQGQFKTLESYLQYMMGNHAMTREQAEEAAHAKTRAKDGAVTRVETLLAHAKSLGIPTASHDDDSVQRIATMRNLGVAMSEFPITLDTARAAVSCGLPTILGAPNVLRGQSQSGSMRAIDAIRAGVASCLCSDYQPSTLIAAAYTVAAQTDLSWPQAIALVTANPADACGLSDRGRIAVGLRADLVAVAQVGALPLISHTWSAGRLVFSTHYQPSRTHVAAAPQPQRVAA
ncbi:phosphonate metabolism protein PhnM [Achromobacter spanius]|uniref:alpha-D-ribose 1-methylphosphonate 5-triphosphate diphosphatase n=1 Tax=Achromobacter spanius TaxID=217203 RepID=UPI000C2B8C0A|nr:alpha-D-ribose 1-methylphosphonate 5-triphosphate diphosphatase [Achromobacter spanius]AUA56922.1 alpha-D-ribose 1-methylphosphonate 5-triphosphate diphosphatase [Achromobacter spanius]CAB3688561.1 Alpha-D-ribose 1-methylphosphonate 5-triphosphate diphosphatase [Achromobacter spanius]SPT40048.1 phosphonate metabolism protein PhnM [Achromobacter denitrificans]VEE55434.1 phosphonate metabolism protein PhnM [Achromobacter spanius]